MSTWDPDAPSNHHATDLWSVFVDLAERQPDVEAVLAPGRPSLRFGDFPARIEAVRRALHAAGIGRGDVVATALPNGADTAVCLVGLGCFATVVRLNPTYSEDEFDRYLKRIQPKALVLPHGNGVLARRVATALGITIVDLIAHLDDACGVFSLHAEHRATPTRPEWATTDDLAFILLTSGSTGGSRLVPLRQRLLLTYAKAAQTYYALGSADRSLHIMPMFHGHGLKASLLNPLINGGGVVCPDRFDATAFFGWLEAFPPDVVFSWVRHQRGDLQRPRTISRDGQSGGPPLHSFRLRSPR
jgi:acyl-CoA synthetase (AMP-forming)/AMP-acid ligase II